jgi:hypothetical protein
MTWWIAASAGAVGMGALIGLLLGSDTSPPPEPPPCPWQRRGGRP